MTLPNNHDDPPPIDFEAMEASEVRRLHFARAAFVKEAKVALTAGARYRLITSELKRQQAIAELQKAKKRPGHRLQAVMDFLLPTKVFNRLIADHLSEYRNEYDQSLAQGRLVRARYIHLLMYAVIAVTLFAEISSSTLAKFLPKRPS